MTRTEFIEDVNSFYELIEFCQDERIDYCDDLITSDYANQIILERLREFDNWEDAWRYLDEIPQECEYYREDGYGSLESADDMFEDYKQDVIDHMDTHELWDGQWDEEYEEYEEYEDTEDEDEDFPVSEDVADEDITDLAIEEVLGKVG